MAGNETEERFRVSCGATGMPSKWFETISVGSGEPSVFSVGP